MNLKNNNYLNDNYNQCNNDIKTSSSSSIDNDKFYSNFNKYFCGDYKKINNGNEENIFLNNTNSALFIIIIWIEILIFNIQFKIIFM